MGNSGHPVNYLRISFNAFYYLGIFPFRFRLNRVTNRFEMSQYPVQRVICFLVFTVGVNQFIFTVRSTIHGIRDKNDPLSYFKLASLLSGTLFLISIFISLWCKSKKFLIVFNRLQNSKMNFISKRGKKATYLTPIVLCTILVYPFIQILNSFNRRGYDWAQVLERSKSRGIKILFLQSYSDLFADCIPLTIIFVTYDFLSFILFIFISTFGEILLLNCAFCLGDLVDEFAEFIKYPEATNLKVLDQYESLRQITNALNDAVGVSIMGEVLTSLPYFVSNFVEFIHPPNLFVFFFHLIEFGNIFGFILLAANVHRKASAIEEWILDHHNLAHLSYSEINILLHNIASKSIAFNGNGFFKITSGFLGSFVSLLLTFSVILIQFQNQPEAGVKTKAS